MSKAREELAVTAAIVDIDRATRAVGINQYGLLGATIYRFLRGKRNLSQRASNQATIAYERSEFNGLWILHHRRLTIFVSSNNTRIELVREYYPGVNHRLHVKCSGVGAS
jgi:hypothetical protein